MVLGQSMIRVDDGMKGTVEMVGDALRIAYLDRGEMRFAGKGEKWDLVKTPPRRMIRDEMLSVASAADVMLRGKELNQPVRWWDDKQPVHDQGLIDVIVAYLEKR